jgi:hypothetical protein
MLSAGLAKPKKTLRIFPTLSRSVPLHAECPDGIFDGIGEQQLGTDTVKCH